MTSTIHDVWKVSAGVRGLTNITHKSGSYTFIASVHPVDASITLNPTKSAGKSLTTSPLAEQPLQFPRKPGS